MCAEAAPGYEASIEDAKNIVNILYEVTASRPHEWETCLPSARSVLACLDRLRFLRDLARFTEQAWIIQGLLESAYHDTDNSRLGSNRDIAETCQASWLRVFRTCLNNIEFLTVKLACSSMVRGIAIRKTDFKFRPQEQSSQALNLSSSTVLQSLL